MKAMIVVATTALITGCASITDGTTQAIIFNLDPKDAKCVASREGVELGSVTRSQQTLTVGKGAKDIMVSCRAVGFEDKTMRLVSKTQAAGIVGGIFLDLGVVDMLTGAMWKYPESVSIALDPLAQPAVAAAPAVQAAALVPPAPVASAPIQGETASADAKPPTKP